MENTLAQVVKSSIVDDEDLKDLTPLLQMLHAHKVKSTYEVEALAPESDIIKPNGQTGRNNTGGQGLSETTVRGQDGTGKSQTGGETGTGGNQSNGNGVGELSEGSSSKTKTSRVFNSKEARAVQEVVYDQLHLRGGSSLFELFIDVCFKN